jgi:phosphoenolpyruvate carboxylase
VTAEVTRETFRELRQATLQVLLDAVGALSRQLTMTRHEQKASEELMENIDRMATELSAGPLLQLRPDEPWRQFSLLVQQKLSYTFDNKGYTSPFELSTDLLLLAWSL